MKGADIDNPDRADSFVNMVTKVPPAWTKPFMEFLEHGTLPEDEVERQQIVHRAKGYTIINGQLYKRSTTGVYLKCVSQQRVLKSFVRSISDIAGIMPLLDR